MSVISQGTTRIYTSAVNPTNNEPGAEQGNFWLNTATNQLFVNAVETPAAQVWPNASINQITQFNVLVGGAANAITSVAPSATAGIPFVSTGAASNPSFSTAVVAGGGTGATTLTGVLTGNGTSPFTASAVTQFGVVVGGAANAVASTAVGSTGQVLQANTGAAPTYSTATYPSTTTINQILYSSAGNIVAGLPTANTAILTTSAAGVPSLTAAPLTVPYGGTGATTFTAFGVLTGGTVATNPVQSISPGTAGQVLRSAGAAAVPAFGSTPSFMAFQNTNSAAVTGGGATVTFQTALAAITVAYDVTASFSAATGNFTVPTTGKYFFHAQWWLTTLAGAMTECEASITTSRANRLLQTVDNPNNRRAGAGVNVNSATFLVAGYIDLTAGDTVNTTFIARNGANNAVVAGSATAQQTFFSGHLVTTQ